MSRPDQPTQADVIRAWIAAEAQDTHGALVARVQHYDAAAQTADLVPVVRHAVEQPDGSTVFEELPVLPAVPVLLPRVAGMFLSLPIAAGDFLLVVVLDAATEHWRAGDGSAQYPGDLRRRSLGSVVAIPGLFPSRRALAHASSTDLVVGSDAASGARVNVTPGDGGDVVVNGGALKVARVTDPVRVGVLSGANGGGPVNFVFQPVDADGAPAGPPITGVTVLVAAVISRAGGAQHFKG